MQLVTAYLVSLFAWMHASDSMGERILPQGYFGSPLEIPLELSGSFGEPRRLHFHTGIDLKTQQTEGLNVLAAADGYVSRINVSGIGYGNALYITHPNGYTTVYAHLKKYAPRIEAALRAKQYELQNSAVDFNLAPGELTVAKGEVVALSGNTGGSGGPHLHFEIRDQFENVWNPLLFGYKVKDKDLPVISFVKFYHRDPQKIPVEGFRQQVSGTRGNYVIPNTVRVNTTRLGIAVNCWDLINAGANSVGIYSLKMLVDSVPHYEYRVDQMGFQHKRCVMSHVDYPIFMNEGRKSFHKCFTEPGNTAPIYPDLIDGGTVDLSDGLIHIIQIEASDFSGNVSRLRFTVVLDPTAPNFQPKPFTFSTRMEFNRDNVFERDGFLVHIPAGKLFDDAFPDYKSFPPAATNILSDVHTLGTPYTHLLDWADISITPTRLPEGREDKMVVVYKGDGGESSLGGSFDGKNVNARFRQFGTFFIKADTTAPRITPFNIVPNRYMRNYRKLVFKIGDNLSGISKYDMYVNGQWVVCEYDGKTASLWHELDLSMTAGTHEVEVVVSDERKNEARYTVRFRM